MARRSKRYLAFRREFTCPTMTYLTTAQHRALEDAAKAEGIGMAAWLRRLVAGELSRLEVRKQRQA
jgi:hypothetical protein